jgi:hypothetical protein
MTQIKQRDRHNVTQTESKKDTERGRERRTYRLTSDTQKDRQEVGQTDRQRDIQTNRYTHSQLHKPPETWKCRQTDTHSETCKQTDSETDRHTNVEKPDTQIVIREDTDGKTTFNV